MILLCHFHRAAVVFRRFSISKSVVQQSTIVDCRDIYLYFTNQMVAVAQKQICNEANKQRSKRNNLSIVGLIHISLNLLSNALTH